MDFQKNRSLIGSWISPWKKVPRISVCDAMDFCVYYVIQFSTFPHFRVSIFFHLKLTRVVKIEQKFIQNDWRVWISCIPARATSIDLSKLWILSAAEWEWKTFPTNTFSSFIESTQGIDGLCGKLNFMKSIGSCHTSHYCPQFWLFKSNPGISLFDL